MKASHVFHQVLTLDPFGGSRYPKNAEFVEFFLGNARRYFYVAVDQDLSETCDIIQRCCDFIYAGCTQNKMDALRSVDIPMAYGLLLALNRHIASWAIEIFFTTHNINPDVDFDPFGGLL